MNTTRKFFIQCVKEGIENRCVEKIDDEIDFDQLYHLIASHSVDVIALCALKNVIGSCPKKFSDLMNNSAIFHIGKANKSYYDIDIVISAFEEGEIKFMPLKGYWLKKLYPMPEMRFTSDCDILIDVNQNEKVRGIMKNGHNVYRFDEHHDIFYSQSNTVFELHKKLFVGSLSAYFGIGFERAHLCDGYKYLYKLSPEDFYITILAHSAYHFAEGGGVGIRHLCDIYLYKKNNRLNYAYIDEELKKCGLYIFKNQFEKLASCFFDDLPYDNFTLQLADYVLDSTVLANKKMKSASEISAAGGKEKKPNKLKALLRAIFPAVHDMVFLYPVLKKAIILLPFFYVVRWFRVIFKNPKNLSRMGKIALANNDDVNKVFYLRKSLGINDLNSYD